MVKRMYFDSVNDVYTLDGRYVPVYRGIEDGIYIETWRDDEDRLCDFSFSQYTKDLGCVDVERRNYYKVQNFEPKFLKKLVLSPKYFDEMYDRFY